MALKPKPAAASNLVDFGDPGSDIYSQSFDLPEGDYVWTDIDVRMWSGFKEGSDKKARLGVMVEYTSLTNPDFVQPVFYSMGTRASESFAPDPVTGKGLVVLANGTGSGKLPQNTNWIILIKSLVDAGLPKGVFTNDVGVFIGMHTHQRLIPEPEERSTYKSTTGDAPQEEKKFKQNISVVGEILDSGKPWEGTGGLPDGKPAAKKAPGPVKVATKPAKKEEPAEETVEIDETVEAAAIGALAEILSKLPANKAGVTMPTAKAGLKVKAFKYIQEAFDEDTANTVASLWDDDDILNKWLETISFKAEGPMVKPLS